MATFVSKLSVEVQNELISIAKKLLKEGKGILAADESIGNIGSKFDLIKVENNADNRCKYREMLFSLSEKDLESISGVILVDETLFQTRPDGEVLVNSLIKNKILLGIKLDKGPTTLAGTNETCTQGLDNLAQRCREYKKNECDFAKWRCTFRISSSTPSEFAITKNANVLAQYAAICQENRIVPIVEPELLMDGPHGLEISQKVTENILVAVFKALHDHHVFLEGILLKTNMVTSGNICNQKYTHNDVALATLTALTRTVPAAVPGIVFLSGGQSEEEATMNLNAINQVVGVKPWVLSFSFGRALQASALRVWAGKDENVRKAQKELAKRIKANGLACLGRYSKNNEEESVQEESTSLFVADYQY